MTEPTIFITSVKLLRDHVLRVHFSDGKFNDVDFHDFLAGSIAESERRYLHPKLFKKFELHGRRDLIWGDFDLCIPFAALRMNDPEVSWDGVRSPQPTQRSTSKATTAVVRKNVRTVGQRKRVRRTVDPRSVQ